MVNSETHQVVASKEDEGKRVDVFLSSRFEELSRSKIQSLLKAKLVKSNKKTVEAASKVSADELFTFAIPNKAPLDLRPQDIPLEILFEDEDIFVINKQAGLVVHPGAGNPSGTLVNALLFRFPNLTSGEDLRPGLVHRLDKDTSGVMVCTKNEKAHMALNEAFKARDVKKYYRAFCFGSFKTKKFELKTGHKRHPTNRKRFSTKYKIDKNTNLRSVRVAHSLFEVLEHKDGISELKVDIKTGRTHQIRAHLADIGHPLLKDELYNGKRKLTSNKIDINIVEAYQALNRHALHAEYLAFIHPTTMNLLEFKAPLPCDLESIHLSLIK